MHQGIVPAPISAPMLHANRRPRRVLAALSLLGPYLGLLLVIGLFTCFTWRRGEFDRFFSTGNAKVVAVHAAITATVALGMTIVMISGGIDLSVGYVVSLI